MENQKAIEILRALMEKNTLTADEKEAVWTSIGLLGWVNLAQSRVKSIKDKKDRSTRW